MKKIVFVFVMVLLLCSCSDVYDEIIITDINRYGEIWTLPERRASENSLLFPSEIDSNSVEMFRCNHTTYQYVGTGWQVEIVVKYTKDEFNKKREDIEKLTEKSVVVGNTPFFGFPVYATVWNWNGCFEYALVNETEHSIAYIYLQLIDKNDLVISNEYVPTGYEMSLDDGKVYSVYE